MTTNETEPAVFYMLPMFGVPYFEVLNAPADFDALTMVRDSAARARETAATVKGKGSRRYKADYLRKAELCEMAIADWSEHRLSRTPSGALVVSLARSLATEGGAR